MNVKKHTNLFHSAGGSPVAFGPHELERRSSLAEDWICQNIQPIHFNQNSCVAQPGDSHSWRGVRRLWVSNKVRLHHRERTIQGLWDGIMIIREQMLPDFCLRLFLLLYSLARQSDFCPKAGTSTAWSGRGSAMLARG